MSSFLYNLKNKLRINIKKIFWVFVPKDRTELLLLIIIMCFYLSYSIYLALNTSVVDNNIHPFDLYFSFDNPSIFHKGFDNIEGHPLILLITQPILLIGKFLIFIFDIIKAKTIFIVIICSYLIAMSSLYIYKY